MIHHLLTIGAQTEHHILHRSLTGIEANADSIRQTPQANVLGEHNLWTAPRSTSIGVGEAVAMRFAHSILSTGLADFPSCQIHIRVDRHNVGSWTLYHHFQCVGDVAHGAIHIRLTIVHTTQLTSFGINRHHRFIAARPREHRRVDRHGDVANGVGHFHRIILKAVGDDGVVLELNAIVVAENLHRHGGGHIAIVGGNQAVASTVAKKQAILLHMAHRFGASERNAVQVGVDEQAIFVVAVEFWAIDAVFWHFCHPIHKGDACDGAIVGGCVNGEDAVTVGAFGSVAWHIAHTERT